MFEWFFGGLNSLASSLSLGGQRTSAKGITNIFIILSPYLYWRRPFWQSMFSANIFPANQCLYCLTIYFSTRSRAVRITRSHATRGCARQLCFYFTTKSKAATVLVVSMCRIYFSTLKQPSKRPRIVTFPFTHTTPFQIVISFLRPLNLYGIAAI